MMNNGIEMLNDTLSIFEKGYYYIDERRTGKCQGIFAE